ncbi:DUF3493 domain-containing protein [Leptodesmis sichuanensis]|uniref:DUF3493 domain-containing protein n=1 Tax=Leptodesmis sichuanensis TaxID=2906798 RepID=UPI001F2FF74C|nr:DUF3493 domain-containing protein [Leptodesmis sichuanensis]UIE38477.1 DUF3493 domain-containing protein [Leptodesmis sichuanensis A121]
MTDRPPNSSNAVKSESDRIPPPLQQRDPKKYAHLRAEAAAPYRGLRRFIYISFAASGSIGAFIFLTQLLAGRDVTEALPNFAIQIAVVALMVWLLQLESKTEQTNQAKGKRQKAAGKD